MRNFFGKILLVFFCVQLINSPCNGKEINYSLFENVEDLLAAESNAIAKCCRHDMESLADLYISRGETYLLNVVVMTWSL
jgi:hypothetical protein